MEMEKAYNLFLNTNSAKSPEEAYINFNKVYIYLMSSLSWIPNKRPKISLWETEVDQQELVNIWII